MTTKQLTRNALFLALIIIAGMIAIPVPGVPVPIVLQNMLIMLAGFFLGRKHGVITVVSFLLLVFVGLPLLAGGRGGAAIFVSPSGGFLLGYVLSPLFVGSVLPKLKRVNVLTLFLVFFFGSALVIDLLGGISIALAGHLSLVAGLKSGLAFLPVDALKALLAALICERLYKYNLFGFNHGPH